MKLKDKVSIVTGSTRGIGRAAAIALAQEGSHVVVTGRNEERAKETAAKIEAMRGKVLVILGDVGKTEDVNRVVEKSIEFFGKIDILVNNAASVPRISPVAHMEDKEWNILNEDVVGYFRFCRAVIPHIAKQKKGKIVNVSSVIAETGFPGLAPLCASKGAVNSFSFSLARELAPLGICVNVVSPGLVDTESSRELFSEIDGKEDGPIFKKYLEEIPLQRLATVEEVARAVVYLASEDADYITGQILAINGGVLMKA